MKILWIFLLLIFFSHLSFGQIGLPSKGDTSQITLTLKNGAVYTGKLVDRNEAEVMLMDNGKVYTLNRTEIQEVKMGVKSRKVIVTLKSGVQHKGVLIKESGSEAVIRNETGQLFFDMDQVDTIETDYEKEFVRILMKDGTLYEGYRRKDQEESNIVHTDLGKVMYDTSQVAQIKIIDESKAGYFDHPLSARYFLSPTAIPLRKGEKFYSNQNIFLSSFQYGVTKNVSIGAGFETISTFFLLTPTPFANVKVSFAGSENFHYGGGLIVGGIFGQLINEYEYFASPYGVLTWGDRDKNITLGGGVAFISNERLSYINVSGTLRLSRRLGLISSNLLGFDNIGGGSEIIGLQGIRIMGENIDVDLALAFIPPLIANGIILPYIGFSLDF